MSHHAFLEKQLEAAKMELLRLQSLALIAEISFTMEALLAHELEKALTEYFEKACYNPNQPRIPRGNSDDGRNEMG